MSRRTLFRALFAAPLAAIASAFGTTSATMAAIKHYSFGVYNHGLLQRLCNLRLFERRPLPMNSGKTIQFFKYSLRK